MLNRRTIAIADIHGCETAMRVLLAALELQQGDTLVMLGDAIDRGPNSRDVIEQLLAWRDQCHLIPILGNHEQMLLDAVENRIPLHDWLIHGGAETLDSYGKNSPLGAIPEEHLAFIRTWGDYCETENHFFAHGNYQADLPLADQPWEKLRWRSLKYSTPQAHQSGKKAILGHTSQKQGEIVDYGYLICIDTYCHGGKWLTALEPETGKVWQSNQRGKLRSINC